jgi:hypothetical protein
MANPFLPFFQGPIHPDAEHYFQAVFAEFWISEGYKLPDPLPLHGRIDSETHSIRFAVFVEEYGWPCLDFFSITPAYSTQHVRIHFKDGIEMLPSFREAMQFSLFRNNSYSEQDSGIAIYNELTREVLIEKGFMSEDE